jgi:hypothetical protein
MLTPIGETVLRALRDGTICTPLLSSSDYDNGASSSEQDDSLSLSISRGQRLRLAHVPPLYRNATLSPELLSYAALAADAFTLLYVVIQSYTIILKNLIWYSYFTVSYYNVVRLGSSSGSLSLRRCATHHLIGAPSRYLVCCDVM